MKIKYKKISTSAREPFKTHDEDFCYDVIATSMEYLNEKVIKYNLGLAFQICRTDNQKSDGKIYSIDFRPRSSVWKTGLSLANCTGTIDELYRGEVSVIFYHVIEDLPIYKVGDKIGQIKIGITEPIEFEESAELNETKRGSNGFGSTDK